MSEKRLQILAKRDALECMKGFKVSFKPCTHCFAGKQHKTSFQYKAPHRRPNILDLMHSNVWSNYH